MWDKIKDYKPIIKKEFQLSAKQLKPLKENIKWKEPTQRDKYVTGIDRATGINHFVKG